MLYCQLWVLIGGTEFAANGGRTLQSVDHVFLQKFDQNTCRIFSPSQLLGKKMLRRIRQYVLPPSYAQDLEENIIALLLMRTNRIESVLDARLFTTGRESSVVRYISSAYSPGRIVGDDTAQRLARELAAVKVLQVAHIEKNGHQNVMGKMMEEW
jgi:hypothetical protein